MTPDFGTIVRDRTQDVGLVLGHKRDQVQALWEDSGEVLSVFPETITEQLERIDSNHLLLAGTPESGILGFSHRAFEQIRRWAPKFPSPSQRMEHCAVLRLAPKEGRSIDYMGPLLRAFDDHCATLSTLARVKALTKALHSGMAHLVTQEFRMGRLGSVDAAAHGILSLEGHKAYTQVKRDIVLEGEGFKHLSEEQRLAAAATTLPTLVTARAGTGKTTTLVARACALMSDLGVPPEQILILVFNKKATVEITERLEQQFPGRAIPTALTFHALAYQVVNPSSSPLRDEDGPTGERKQSKFIEDTIRANWTPHVEVCVQKILSESAHEVWLENGLMNAPDEHYLRYRSNLPHYTLRAERVKSAGEKIIADFYARHGLDYFYEKGTKWENRWYFPDFTLLHQGQQVIHEHWGISFDPGNQTVPGNWTKSHADYRADMARKREFWSSQGVQLLETSLDELREGREAFEAQLSQKLKILGIPHSPLSDRELLSRIVPLHKNRIRAIFSNFIGRMKSSGHTLDSIWEKIRACHPEVTTEAFLNVCSLIYTKYQERLVQEARYDFSDLLDQAHRMLRQDGPTRSVIQTQKYRVDLANLRYVMIDEFQDFNLQFSNLVAALKTLNPSVNVFCVGDDWQAINAFMGADTSYFFDFRDPDHMTMNLQLTIARRCPHSHVARSNALMKSMGGISARSMKKDGPEPIRIEKLPENMSLLTRKLAGIIRDHGRKKSYAVLFRTNSYQGRDIDEVYTQVTREYSKVCGEAWKLDGRPIKLTVSTVHGFKGKEADVVVIADASAHSYPLLHPDGVFFEAFGDSVKRVIQNEQRLFYVALTRSKEHLRILYDDKIGPSPFLEDAGLLPPRRVPAAGQRQGGRRPPPAPSL